MPIYRYVCSKCGEFEVIQSASAKPCKSNPECEEKDCPCDAQRQISRPTFQLAGDGWYKDAYGSKKGGTEKSEAKDGGSTTTTAAPKGCGSKCSCH
jgi:putative FmdB family regulatory protein